MMREKGELSTARPALGKDEDTGIRDMGDVENDGKGEEKGR